MTAMTRNSFRHARQRYQEIDLSSRLHGADPHELIAILYEELINALDVMAARLRRGSTLSHDDCCIRAHSILTTLMASLDPDGGGNAALLFGDVYRGMIAGLKRTIANNDSVLLAELREAVHEMQSTWLKLKGTT